MPSTRTLPSYTRALNAWLDLMAVETIVYDAYVKAQRDGQPAGVVKELRAVWRRTVAKAATAHDKLPEVRP